MAQQELIISSSAKMRPAHLFLSVILFAVALKSTLAIPPPFGYVVFDNTSGTPDNRFEKEIGTEYGLQALEDATEFVLKTFGQSVRGGKEYDTVEVVVDSFVANGRPFAIATTNGSQIYVNADYLQAFPGNVKNEFTGILYFTSSLVWGWTGNGNAPTGVVTGIADYMRLTSGWEYQGWPQQGSGLRWDEGNGVTANFFQYCEGLRPGFVADLNAMMIFQYSDAYFVELLGYSVNELWLAYKLPYGAFEPAPAQTLGH